jgi:hypothetical protein
MEWKPIETARVAAFDRDTWYMPHSERLLLWDGYPRIGGYHYTRTGKGNWKVDDGRVIHPTHWMPLPGAPTKETR